MARRINRRRPSVDDYVVALCARDRKQAERDRREHVISQLAHQSEHRPRQMFLDRLEVVVAVLILAAVEIIRTGGA